MHTYKIEIFAYTPEGAVGEKIKVLFEDNVATAEAICEEYSKQYQLVENEDGEMVRTNNKKYKVNLYVLAYKLCADKEAFFNNFKA